MLQLYQNKSQLDNKQQKFFKKTIIRLFYKLT